MQRVCPTCQRLSPGDAPACAQCGVRFRNEMAWKLPLIVLLFVAAFLLSVWLQSL